MNVGWFMRKSSKPSSSGKSRAIDAMDVHWAYHTILGREPESDAVIESWCESGRDLKDMVGTFLTSTEYRQHWVHPSDAAYIRDKVSPHLPPAVNGELKSAVAVPASSTAGSWPDHLINAVWGKTGLQEGLLRSLPAGKTNFPDGWATLLELRSLYSFAIDCPGAVLEVGPWIGRSTTAICLGLRDRKLPRVAFDTVDFGHTGVDEWIKAFGGFPTRPEVAKRFLGPLEHPGGSLAVLIAMLRENKLLDQVTAIVRGDFIEMPLHRTYSLIFCDTTHNVEEAKRNVPKLALHANSGAVMIFDDVIDENFAETICSYLPRNTRVLLHKYDQYSKYMLVKLDE
jgi:predicted O-methyltransferase YrrM